MDVVLPRDADATVDLHAVVDEVEAPVGDIRLGHAHEARRVFVTQPVDRLRRGVADRLRELEPHEHVGDPVLERLERGDGPAERVPVLCVLDGELEHAIGRADGLRALQRERDLELVLHRGGRATDVADDGRRGNVDAVEVDRSVASHEVDAAPAGDGDPVGAGRARSPG